MTHTPRTGHSDRALRWQVLGRDVRPATLFLSLNTGYVGAQAILGRTRQGLT